jgi:hypothetical protein
MNYTNDDIENTFKFLLHFINPISDALNYMTKMKIDDTLHEIPPCDAPRWYRKHIIADITKHYTIEEFYKYEKIFNSLIWNLKNKLNEYIVDNTVTFRTTGEIEPFPPASYITSHVQYNELNNQYYILNSITNGRTQGQCTNVINNKLDDICINIIFNGEYLHYYLYPEQAVNYDKIIDTYYRMNYPFPNANCMFNNMNNISIWKEKIKRMYYSDPDGDNWYYVTPVTHLLESIKDKIDGSNDVTELMCQFNEKVSVIENSSQHITI